VILERPTQACIAIIGAGFAGSVVAERFASQRRSANSAHRPASLIRGDAYNELDAHGVLIHHIDGLSIRYPA